MFAAPSVLNNHGHRRVLHPSCVQALHGWKHGWLVVFTTFQSFLFSLLVVVRSQKLVRCVKNVVAAMCATSIASAAKLAHQIDRVLLRVSVLSRACVQAMPGTVVCAVGTNMLNGHAALQAWTTQ